MDDNKFDNAIRSKLEGYLYPAVDSTALEALHQQQNAVPGIGSWYSRHRMEIVVGSAIAVILLMYLLGYTYVTHTVRVVEEQNAKQKVQIAGLENEIKRLRQTKPDTVRITEVRTENDALTSQLLQRIVRLEESNQELLDFKLKSGQIPTPTSGEESNPSPLVMIDSPQLLALDSSLNDATQEIVKKEISDHNSQKALDTKSIRALEKHYIHGVGIKLGPVVDIFGGRYSLGNGNVNLSGGLLADFILSPSLGLETGLKYSARYYAIVDPNNLASTHLPGVDPQVGTLQRAEIDYQLFEIPLTLKYRYPLSIKDHLIGGLGYSCLVYLNQDFEYTYEFDNQSPNPTSIVSTVTTDQIKAYPGTINITLGMSHALKNKKIIETMLFYNHGIGTQGVEKTRAQYFGLRGTYWFTLK